MSATHEPVRPSVGSSDPTRTSPSDLGVGQLLGTLTDQFTTLVRQEVELAKAEAKQELTVAAKAGAGFGAAAVAGHLAALLLSLAAAWGLAELMAPGLAFLIVGVIWAIVAGAAATKAKKQADELDPELHQTTQSLQETADWAKDKP